MSGGGVNGNRRITVVGYNLFFVFTIKLKVPVVIAIIFYITQFVLCVYR